MTDRDATGAEDFEARSARGKWVIRLDPAATLHFGVLVPGFAAAVFFAGPLVAFSILGAYAFGVIVAQVEYHYAPRQRRNKEGSDSRGR